MTLKLSPISSQTMTLDEAILYCTFYNHDGDTIWRLPTKLEWLYMDDLSGCWYDGRMIVTRDEYYVRLVSDE